MMHIDVIKVRDFMRSIAAASAVVLATGTGAVFAQVNVTGSNTITGANSVNDNNYSVDDDVTVDVSVSDLTVNDVSADAMTGGVSASNNTTVGNIDTGALIGDVTLATMSSSSSGASNLAIDPLSVRATFANDTTGANSENINDVTVDRDLSVSQTVNHTTLNNVDVSASTGGVSANQNTTVGDIRTGGIALDGNISTQTTTSNSMNVSGALTAPSVTVNAGNDTTGFQSSNTNTVDVDSDVDVTMNKTTTTTNTVDASASTGGVDVNANTTVGNIRTGGASFTFDVRTTNQ